MRLTFGILFSAIIIAMAVCARIAKNSGKRMGFAAACLLAALILPMAGNGIIIVSGNRTLSLIGWLFYRRIPLTGIFHCVANVRKPGSKYRCGRLFPRSLFFQHTPSIDNLPASEYN